MRIQTVQKTKSFPDDDYDLIGVEKKIASLGYPAEGIYLKFNGGEKTQYLKIAEQLGFGYFIHHTIMVRVDFVKESITGNFVYKINVDGHSRFLVRIFGRDIPRTKIINEIKSLKLASKLGFAELIKFQNDSKCRVVILRFIEGSHLELKNIITQPFLIPLIVKNIYALHTSSLKLSNKNSHLNRVENVSGIMQKSDTPVPTYLMAVVNEMQNLYKLLDDESDTVPCHGDLNPDNIILSSNGVSFIDWEDSCMSSRYIDLAIFSMHMYMLDEQCESLLYCYFPQPKDDYRKEIAKLTIARNILYLAQAIFCFCRPFFKIDPPYTSNKSIEQNHWSKSTLDDKFEHYDQIPNFFDLVKAARSGKSVSLQHDTSQYRGLIYLKQFKESFNSETMKMAINLFKIPKQKPIESLAVEEIINPQI